MLCHFPNQSCFSNQSYWLFLHLSVGWFCAFLLGGFSPFYGLILCLFCGLVLCLSVGWFCVFLWAVFVSFYRLY